MKGNHDWYHHVLPIEHTGLERRKDIDYYSSSYETHSGKFHAVGFKKLFELFPEKKKEILQSLGKLGISYLKAKKLIEKHGQKRIAEVAKHARDQECKNPAGYVIRALKENWTFYVATEAEDYACGNGLAYISGKYAAFIQH